MLRWLTFNALGTWLFTRRHGESVGEDDFGNRYYRTKVAKDWRSERRWVVYPDNVEPEPTLVPPGWNGWLHKRLQYTPKERPLPVKSWEKPHLPNLSGTEYAYAPAGSERRGGKRDKATGDYEAWQP